MPDESDDKPKCSNQLLRDILDRMLRAGWISDYVASNDGFTVNWTDVGHDNVYLVRAFMADLGISKGDHEAFGIIVKLAFEQFPVDPRRV